MRSNVDFPQPLGPTMQRNSSGPTSRLMSCNAWNEPPLTSKTLLTALTLILLLTASSLTIRGLWDCDGDTRTPVDQEPFLRKPSLEALKWTNRHAELRSCSQGLQPGRTCGIAA